MKTVTTLEHYDLLIDEGMDPLRDSPLLQRYMSGWDGPLFFEAVSPKGKTLLEIGIGTGRIAYQMLASGCNRLTGLDISPKTVAKAQENLNDFANMEIVQADIIEFNRPSAFDVAYSVLTFLHIEEKERALAQIYRSLKPGGRFVLSVSRDEEWFSYGDRKLRLYPLSVVDYIGLLQQAGFRVDGVQETDSGFASILIGSKPVTAYRLQTDHTCENS